MTGKWKCVCGWLLCICLLIGTIPTATVNAQETAVADYVTVQDETSFMRALAQGKNILVDGRITIGSEVESNGQMRPVQIPGGDCYYRKWDRQYYKPFTDSDRRR